MSSRDVGAAIFAALFVSVPGTALAVSVTPVNLDVLMLGAAIVGPVGPEVNTSFIDSNGDSIGDLVSSVSCPAGAATCNPRANPSGTVYTYVHVVTPGVDTANDDPPVPNPATVRPFDAGAFQLGFEATGFNGVAGYSFSEATSVLGAGTMLEIELNDTQDGSLTWGATRSAGTTSTPWPSGGTISFFWQSTRAPSGPNGQYLLTDDLELGTAAGPLPNPVPLPAGIVLFLSALGLVGWRGRRESL